jgi:4-amino-4-deoxy-L-arabinose transferase-like glycosyltransferase
LIQAIVRPGPTLIGEPYLIALNIQSGLGYAYAYIGDSVPSITCFIPPLYVLLLVGIMKLGGGIIAMKIINLFFLHATFFVVFRLIRLVTNSFVAVIAFFALELYLPFWIYAGAIDPNSLNMLLIALTIWVLYAISENPRMQNWVALGILIGLQILVRPDMMLGVVFFVAWLIYALGKRQALSKTIGSAAVALVLALLIVLPWTIRNYQIFDRIVLVSANSGFNFWMGNNAGATGEFVLERDNPEMVADWHAAQQFGFSHNQVERDQYFMSLGLNWVKAHPMDALLGDLKKVVYHWSSRGAVGDWGGISGVMGYYFVVSLLILIAGIYGFATIKNRKLQWLLASLFAYSTAVSALFFVQTRHRALKVDPFLIPLAVIGVFKASDKLLPKSKSESQTVVDG